MKRNENKSSKESECVSVLRSEVLTGRCTVPLTEGQSKNDIGLHLSEGKKNIIRKLSLHGKLEGEVRL
jgi:hypothetical protein